MIKNLKKLVLHRVPTRLPQGVTEFNAWANDILDTHGLPNNDSTHFALATAIMHAKSGESYFSKQFFAKIIQKGAANQVAHFIMNECKERQQRLADEEKKKADEAKAAEMTLVEDTTSSDAVSLGKS